MAFYVGVISRGGIGDKVTKVSIPSAELLYSAYFVRRFEDKSFVTFAVKEKRRM